MRAVVFVNGVVDDYARMQRWLHPGDYLVGADGGTLHCLAMGLRPHMVVGDLDSLPQAQVAELTRQGTRIHRYPAEKAQTDLELAVEQAIQDGATEILLVGALGGRIDQTLANLLLLAQRTWPVPVRMAEGNQLAIALRGPATVAIHGITGATVSLIPLSAEVTGITYSGLIYPLENHTLLLGSTRGISNAFAQPYATVTIAGGLALLVQEVES
jgi:thiamine pyrophosphokinase